MTTIIAYFGGAFKLVHRYLLGHTLVVYQGELKRGEASLIKPISPSPYPEEGIKGVRLISNLAWKFITAMLKWVSAGLILYRSFSTGGKG